MKISINTPYGRREVSKRVLESLLEVCDDIAFQEHIGSSDPLQSMIEIDKHSIRQLAQKMRHIRKEIGQ